MANKDTTFHYTKPQMARDLISIIPLNDNHTVIDAGSGKNKVWYNNLTCKTKYECEIEDGNNFYDFDKNVDWVIGNPPYHESWKFTQKASEIANIGICWLLNNQALNSHNTPKRIKFLNDAGFYLTKLHVVADERWFGRYYFAIYTKEKNNFLTYTSKSY